MKKWCVILFILIMCIFVGNTTTIFSYAEETNENITISTLYPENVLYYQDLTDLKNISVSNDFIAYNLSDTTLTILNKSSKNIININEFNNIFDFKFVSDNQLIIIDYYNNSGTINFVTINSNTNEYTLTPINEITLSSIKLLDIETNNNRILIGYIKSTTFELLEIELINNIPSTPVKKDTFTSNQLETSKNLVITNNELFVVFSNSDQEPRILTRQYGSSSVTTDDIIANIQLLDYYSFNSKNYLIAFTQSNLYLLPLDDLKNTEITLTELKVSDINVFENKIYLAESNRIYLEQEYEKSISSYIITTEEDNDNLIFQKENVLISSINDALGRFNNVNDLFIQGNTLYVSDTKNNRIQIINNSKTTQINDLLIDSQPHSVQLDIDRNIFFVEKSSTNISNIAKYSLNEEQQYVRTANFSTYDQVSLGLVSDTTITANNELYILDYTNSKLLSLNDQTGLQPKLSFSFNLTSTSKIEYIRSANKLVVLNENIIYLIDIQKLNSDVNPIVDSLGVNNCADITSTLNSIIVRSDNQIKRINIVDNIMQTNEKVLNNDIFMYLSTISYDIANNKIYGFYTSTQSIIYFDYICEDEILQFSNIKENSALSPTTAPFAITVLNNAVIYDLPYNIGNQHVGITNCIGIELYNDTYYRVLFNNNNTLSIGFLNKTNANILEYNTSSKINVITTNLQVPVYKYPTILKYNDQAIINEYIPINTSIKISNKCFPISIDNKLFYAFINNGTIGYIFNADVILDDNSNITALNSNNATIQIIGDIETYIYAEDKTTIIGTLNNDDRVCVENYDKHSEYTLVHFKTTSLTTVTGYVKTDYIEMDKMDNNKILLIVVIIISTIILVVIIISYIIIKKKKN